MALVETRSEHVGNLGALRPPESYRTEEPGLAGRNRKPWKRPRTPRQAYVPIVSMPRLPRVRALTPHHQWSDPFQRMIPWTYDIDVVGTCSLRCPSCPVGNYNDPERPTGLMSVEMFDAIVAKAVVETPDILYIGLFNWGEPLLHPKLSELIRIVTDRRIECRLSTHLNVLKNIEDILRSKPTRLRISLSGFYPATYSRTHKKGDVNVVKGHMHLLRAAMDKLKSETQVQVLYHRYVDNMGEDLEQMQKLCSTLNFTLDPVYAYLMPLEKQLQYYSGELPEKDMDLVRLLAIPPSRMRETAEKHKHGDCVLRAAQTAINFDGSVALCCGTYDSKNTIAKSFLDTPMDELQALKYRHPLCGPCMDHGIHASLAYAARGELDGVASKVQIERGEAFFREGKAAEAIASFRIAEKLDPTNPLARNNLALAYALAGQKPVALNLLEGGYRRFPTDRDTALYFVDLLLDQGQLERARQVVEEALRHHPQEAELLKRWSALCNDEPLLHGEPDGDLGSASNH